MYNFGRAVAEKQIHIINGPNLNLLGKRQPEVYGHQSFEDFLHQLRKDFEAECFISYFHSNIEGELINELQKVGEQKLPILLNAGGYTHTSVAIADAVAAIESPVLEIHISQPAAREQERHNSLLAKFCLGSISGLGLSSYQLGIEYYIKHYERI